MTATITVNAMGRVLVLVDQVPLTFVNGEAKRVIQVGAVYALVMVVIGSPGSKWSVELSTTRQMKWKVPAGTKWRDGNFKIERTLKGPKDAGHIWFQVV